MRSLRSILFMVVLMGPWSSVMAYHYLSAGAGGVAVPLQGNFFSYGTRPTSRNEIEISGYLADYSKDSIDMRYRYYSFRYKRYMTQSLYYAPGFGQRMLRGRLVDETLAFESTRSIDSYGAEFSFGNQWQNGRIRFAIDWLGYYHPLMSTTTRSSYSYLGENGKSFSISGSSQFLKDVKEHDQREWSHSVWDRLAEKGNWILLRLQFGYVF